MEIAPIAEFVLLCRYPYEELGEQGQRVKTKSRNNNSSPYALPPSTEDNQQNNSPGNNFHTKLYMKLVF